MFSHKSLRVFAIVAVMLIAFVAFHLFLQGSERRQCEAWQSRPDLWTELRLEQCQEVGIPLQVSP